MKKSNIILIICLIIMVLTGSFLVWKYLENKKIEEQKRIEEEKKKTVEKIESHYHTTVKVNKKTDIFEKEKESYQKAGTLEEGMILSLKEQQIDENTTHFIISSLEQEYHIQYENVEPLKEKKEIDTSYKNYIPFNQNIITKKETKFYQNGLLMMSLNKSFEFPIIVKNTDSYTIEYQGEAWQIKKEDIEKTISKTNTQKTIATSIPVLNYHFFYDPDKGETCYQEICHSKQLFQSHIDLLKKENYLTITTKELEQFMDGKLQLPKKSVLITIDDGHLMKLGIQMLAENNLKGTVFLITGAYPKPENPPKTIEFHSHSHNLHTQGACPTGQGGGIQCLNKNTLLADLKKSREALNGSTVFCYPFYEYNSYSISVLKEAGFTMAFAGTWSGGTKRPKVGTDKFQIPRYVIGNATSANDLKWMLENE